MGNRHKGCAGQGRKRHRSIAGLSHVMARRLEPSCGCEILACSFKAAIRFFDLRMALGPLGTSVIDAEATESAAPAQCSDAAVPPSQGDLLGRILRSCPEDSHLPFSPAFTFGGKSRTKASCSHLPVSSGNLGHRLVRYHWHILAGYLL